MSRRKTVHRRKWYPFLCHRDGERCAVCGRTPPEVYLEIDHKDGKKNHNPKDGSNYQLLCRSDNRIKNPRGKGKHHTARYGVSQIGREMTPEMIQNKRCEPAWLHWLFETMKKRGRMPIKDIIFEGAQEVNCSPETIRQRYLPKVTSRASTALYRRFFDDAAECDIVTFKDAASVGINPSDYFIDDPVKETE